MQEGQGLAPAVKNDKVGAGIYIPDPVVNGSPIEMSHHIGERFTVFQAETFAVEQAAKLLRDNGTTNKTIVINCDSQAAIRAVDSTIMKSKTTQRARNKLHELGIKTITSYYGGYHAIWETKKLTNLPREDPAISKLRALLYQFLEQCGKTP